MNRIAWSAVTGIGIAGALLATPLVRGAAEETKGHSTSADETRQGGTATGGASTAPQDQPGAKSGTTPSSEGARGSGMGGTSTGARPGEVSGAGPAGEVSASAGAAKEPGHEISGKVDKYDREHRTLSLANSPTTLQLSDDTEVVKDGQKVSPGQIMEGDEVRASYAGSGETVQAQHIEISSGTPSSTGTGGTSAGPATGTESGSAPGGGSPKGTAAGKGSDVSGGSTGGNAPPR
ncbi:MAG TPA: hypothetical protein VEK86_04070 [Gemmatimonadales bacterium]|nr:hypothetical protein [Gemmatimonadales bacterium]